MALKSILAGLLCCVAVALPVQAQTAAHSGFPERPIRWVVGYPAGGGTDFLARTVGADLMQRLGQPVVIDNRPGASAILAADNVAHSPHDGYTMLSADNGVLIYNGELFKKLPYSERDFEAVGMMGRSPLLVVAAPNSGIRDAQTLLARLKAEPGKLAMATPGKGSPHHLALELFQRELGVQLLHVPYKGGAAAIKDVMADQVPLMMLDLPSGIAAVKSGKVTPVLAVTAERIAQLPKLPTAVELGYAAMQAYTWQGLVLPKGVDKAIQTKLEGALGQAMQAPAVKKALYDSGWEVKSLNGAQWQAYVEAERARWLPFIRASGLEKME